ncbi:hypothetical protein [Cellulomonas soli]
MPTSSSATLPSDVAPTAAADLFAVAGFTLPASASDLSVRLIDHPPYEDVSVTTFRAPRADAIAMFEATGYTVVQLASVSWVDAEIMGGFTPPEGSWSVMPDTATMHCYVNISNQDPALVTALIYYIPSR